MAARHDPADDGGVVAGRPLDQPVTARGQVVGHPGSVQRERIHVDHVHVTLLADADDTAVVQTEQRRGVVRLLADDVLQRQRGAAMSITRPVRQQERRI